MSMTPVGVDGLEMAFREGRHGYVMTRIEFVPDVAPDGTVRLRAQATPSLWERLKKLLAGR
jgi:hypothetical protein